MSTSIVPIAATTAETPRAVHLPSAKSPAGKEPHTGPVGTARSFFSGIAWGEMAAPIAVLSIVLAMILPLPPFLLDLLISANITLSVIVLLVSMYITKPVDPDQLLSLMRVWLYSIEN